MMSRRPMSAAFGALLVVSAVVRIGAVAVPGHLGDIRVMARWAERMADVGPLTFYDGSGSIYPVLLYPLWGLGSALDGDALLTAIKALSIPFDLAIGVALFLMARRDVGDGRAIAAAALYLVNPAVILAGPVWGQVDAVGTLAFVGAVAASAAGRHGTAAALGVVATLVKPQFGFAALVVVTVAAIRARSARSWRPLAGSVVGGVAAYAVVAAPLGLHPARYVDLLRATASFQPYTSLHAFNPWGLVVGFRVPDEPYVAIGAVLLVVAVAATLARLSRGTDLGTLLAVAAVLTIAFYMLPTRVHERYLFPAMALLVPFAILGRRPLAAYVALAAGFAASLVYALVRTTPFPLPGGLADPITSPIAVWAIGGVLMAASAWWAWALAVRRPPPLRHDDR